METNNIYFDMLNDNNFIDMIVRHHNVIDKDTASLPQQMIGGKKPKNKTSKKHTSVKKQKKINNNKILNSYDSSISSELDIDTSFAVPHAGFPPIYICDKQDDLKIDKSMRTYANVSSAISIRDIMAQRRTTPLLSL